MNRWLDSRFAFGERGTDLQTEASAGLATFMTMAYIIFVNPAILSAAGMPFAAAAAATCLGAAVPTLIMGVWANTPIALASGMGLNAAVAMHAAQPGLDWQTMMGVIVVEGAIVTVLVLTRCRERVMSAIPASQKNAIAAGIGVFIAFLGFQQIGLVTRGEGGAFLTHGDLNARMTLIGVMGVLAMAALYARGFRGAILYGVFLTALAAGVSDLFVSAEERIVRWPDAIVAAPDLSAFAQANVLGALRPALAGVVFAFLITDFFDTMGTVIAVGGKAGLLDKDGSMPGLKRVLLTDSFGAMWGGFCGASSSTTYIESAAGVSAGGRTGFVCVVVSLLFFSALFFSPLVGAIPAVATAPALVFVGALMMGAVKDIPFENVLEGAPAFLTLLLIPLTQSISFGIGVGMISLAAVACLTGKIRKVDPWLYPVALAFLVSFVL